MGSWPAAAAFLSWEKTVIWPDDSSAGILHRPSRISLTKAQQQ
jgi:hypothetical protein